LQERMSCSSNVALARHRAKGSETVPKSGKRSKNTARQAPSYTVALVPFGAPYASAEPRQRLL
jgi:hypothetical protein